MENPPVRGLETASALEPAPWFMTVGANGTLKFRHAPDPLLSSLAVGRVHEDCRGTKNIVIRVKKELAIGPECVTRGMSVCAVPVCDRK